MNLIILIDYDDESYAVNPEQIVYVKSNYFNGINGCSVLFTTNTVPVKFKNSFGSVIESLNAWRKKK